MASKHLRRAIWTVSLRRIGTMDYSRFLNKISMARVPSPLRTLNGYIARSPKPIINLAGGLPNANMYPFQSITVTLKDGQQINIDGDLLTTALQYGPSEGYLKLVAEFKDYQKRLHNPQIPGGWTTVITSGSQDAMSKSFEMMLNVGDYVVAEEYIYSGTVSILKPFKVNHLKVKGDKDGIIPDSLRKVLSRWSPEDVKNNKNNVPKILYTIPNGANPVGTSLSIERKKEIYKIAQEYNLMILEDDPYYFISYAKERVPSFLSLDVDGRVLRFDSFSKIMSGGIRLGYVTGPEFLIHRILLHIQSGQLHCSSGTQVIIHETLSRWGFDKFVEHTKTVAKFYESRRDKFLFYADLHLKGLAEWNVPSAGMFFWIKILGVKDTSKIVTEKLLKKYVAFLPGKACTMDDGDTPYVRASFSIASDEEINQGLKMLADCIREELDEINKN